VVVVGLPVLTIALTQLNAHLVRRRSSMAGPVQTLRLYVLPLGALLVLLTQIPNSIIPNDGSGVRIVATIFGFLVLVFILSGLNTALCLNASEGSWRRRMPSIFVDIARIVLIAIGLGFLFSFVWGADVGGPFAALGVTSIVLGLALQTAVGSIIAGLLLLFEQPFQLGDWLSTSAAEGRVVEVVHIDTGLGITIIPNSSLAAEAFTNLSRPTIAYTETIATTFGKDDRLQAVVELLDGVARGLTLVPPGREPSTVTTGAGGYQTSLPLTTFADAATARAQFLTWILYAARRHNLGLDGADIWQGESTADVATVLERVARVLSLPADRLAELATRMDLERYADGEVIEAAGIVPDAMRYLASGR
jgi:small-conductance mechanosensitive channel